MTIASFEFKALPKALLVAVATILVLSVAMLGVRVALASSSGAAINLDQCRNGGLVTSGTQTYIQCTGDGSGNSGWVNGNAGASNAHYAEAESISYRARLTGLNSGDVVSLIMQYDVIHSGKHALDYLTDKNRWQLPETDATATPDKPDDTVGNQTGPNNTYAIPAPTTNLQVDPSQTLASGNCEKTGGAATQQPVTSFNNVPSTQRNMEFFRATPKVLSGDTSAIKYVGPTPNLLDTTGTEAQQIQVTFTANASNPVLAWGGHIASRLDWGCKNAPQSATGISGSPYHMAIVGMIINGKSVNFGSQDRSLSASAVIFFQPTLPTTPTGDGGAIGTVLNDTATVTGGSNPGGTVTFNLYGPNDTSCLGTAIYTQTVAVSGGSATTSPGWTTTAAGTYEWTAHYSGDGLNQPADSTCGNEAVTIGPNSPTLVTNLSTSSTSNTLTLTDSATLSGSANDTSRITISAYSGTGSGACTGTPVETHTETGSTNGDRTYGPVTFGPLAAGHYEFQATIPADGNNNAASSTCSSEPVTVTNSPTAATTQSLIPNDTLTLSGATADAGGHVDFYLFAPGVTCSVGNEAAAAFSQTNVALVSNNHASTSNTGSGTGMYLATTVGVYHWLAIYSGDGKNNPVSSTCTETFDLENG